MAKDLSRYLEKVELPVAPDEVGLRLDHFLVGKIFWRSRSDLQQRIKAGKVLLNDRPGKASSKLAAGDLVVVLVGPEDLPDQDPESVELEVLHENADVIVLNKQPGVLVHPIGRHVYDTIMNALYLRYRLSGEAERGVEPHVVHRLDRDTSGVLVVAKSFPAKQALQDEFQSRRPGKDYLALVAGRVEAGSGVAEEPIGSDDESEIRLKMKVRADGLPSRSEWQVVERFADATLLRVRIMTGRQHQIRVHLEHLGHPILCDPLYGDPRSLGALGGEELLERQALHAERLEIRLPGEEKARVFEAGLPADMAAILSELRAGRALIPGRDVQSGRWRRA